MIASPNHQGNHMENTSLWLLTLLIYFKGEPASFVMMIGEMWMFDITKKTLIPSFIHSHGVEINLDFDVYYVGAVISKK